MPFCRYSNAFRPDQPDSRLYPPSASRYTPTPYTSRQSEPLNLVRGPSDPSNNYPVLASRPQYNDISNQKLYNDYGNPPRAYPVGRENAPSNSQPRYPSNNMSSLRSTPNSYPSLASQANNRPSFSSGNQMVSSYPSASSYSTNQTRGMTSSSSFPTSSYNSSYQPQSTNQGSYNANVMNRQAGSQMYGYYEGNKMHSGQERQPPVGQSNQENRGPGNYPNYSSRLYNNPAPAPTYKQLEYGKQGLVTGSLANQPYHGYAERNGAPRNSLDQRSYANPPGNQYGVRQPAYQ